MVGATGGLAGTSSLTSFAGRQGELFATGQDPAADFLRILTTQLLNQNPMEPMQDRDIMAQVAQWNILRENEVSNQWLGQLAVQSQDQIVNLMLNNALSVIGKEVTATAGDGTEISGVVTAMVFADGLPELIVAGQRISPASVVQVGSAEPIVTQD